MREEATSVIVCRSGQSCGRSCSCHQQGRVHGFQARAFWEKEKEETGSVAIPVIGNGVTRA